MTATDKRFYLKVHDVKADDPIMTELDERGFDWEILEEPF